MVHRVTILMTPMMHIIVSMTMAMAVSMPTIMAMSMTMSMNEMFPLIVDHVGFMAKVISSPIMSMSKFLYYTHKVKNARYQNTNLMENLNNSVFF